MYLKILKLGLLHILKDEDNSSVLVILEQNMSFNYYITVNYWSVELIIDQLIIDQISWNMTPPPSPSLK